MKSRCLKVPVEMAQFALTVEKAAYKKVRTYLACQFMFAGQVKVDQRPVEEIAGTLGTGDRTVYRHFNWLLQRNWIGKNTAQGWYHFRGLDRVHQIENWKFARAAIMYPEDLRTVKSFFAGAVFASLVESGKGQRTERSMGRSGPAAAPISLLAFAKALGVHKSTAYRLRKLAEEEQYIRNEENLIQITNLDPEMLKHLRSQDQKSFPLELLGYSDRRIVPLDRVRYRNKKLYLQEPNLIVPMLKLKGRRDIRSRPP